MMTPSVTAKPQALEASPVEKVKTAAKQLEAFFLRQMLSEARPQGGGGLDGGFAGDTFKQMLDEALADKMSGAGGLGMSTLFEQQLDGSVKVATAATAPAPEIGFANRRLLTPTGSPIDMTGPSIDGSPEFALPLTSVRATSGFGMRTDPINHRSQLHPGFDLAAAPGTQVGAARGGEVVHAGPAGTYGNLVTIRHADGFETRYAHLQEVHVKIGDRVETGQDIGAVGSTGHSTGPHLHFEIRKEGKALDPQPFLPLDARQKRATR